ncbi:putative GH25 family protein [Chitinophaga skermanii]|uniref:Putative GH25 family protein n=1 Tax=Chitinophaga skermanii TaxID=331697 RepID=A0A327QQK3_9BACT|nr:DUF4198 domain-containing protein [Chitinophaga skermanii]RAJ06620.1 putative GH25 family protein [Chitinophaga skermanii]
MKSRLLLMAAFLLTCSTSFAHMLWIETAGQGTKGKAQTVKVFYGEYSEHNPEKVADWYSNVKEFTLWLTGPDNEKTKLTVTQVGEHFEATFTPTTDGQYTLAISQDAKDLGGETKYQFNTYAIVNVGKPSVANLTGELTVAPAQVAQKANQPMQLKATFQGKPAAGIQIAVFSPSGWNREVVTDANGVATFTPIWAGTYMIEASKMGDETGEIAGKEYKKVWRNAAIAVDIAK